MCGIAAIYFQSGEAAQRHGPEAAARLPGMLATLSKRGPETLEHVAIGRALLGHTRLSIIDLPTGTQPIYNEDRTVAVTLNGEIYNFQELRRGLEARGHAFATRSDTEVLVHLYEEEGEAMLGRLNGMFAFALYDTRRDLLLAARDRTGEKPLLWHRGDGQVLLASEMKALLAHPAVPREIDRDALALYLNTMFVPAPLSIFRGVNKLKPAHALVLQGPEIATRQYWRPSIAVRWGLSEAQAVQEFRPLFADAVRSRVIADVPLGVFLSGGIDSSAVTAAMAQGSALPVRSFTVGFADGNDERPYARIVAERYRTQHTEIQLQEDVRDAVTRVADYFDEPFADSSAVPTFRVAEQARRHVTVILTGDGGDELFAGYDAYLEQKYLLPTRAATRLFKLGNRAALRLAGRELLTPLYRRDGQGDAAFRHWHRARSVVLAEDLPRWLGGPALDPCGFFQRELWLPVGDGDALSAAFAFDLNFYLPDDLLKKVDMAAMMTSLETRAPFLDHRLIEYSLSLPPTLKVCRDRLKHVLKAALAPDLPREVLERGKMGFGAPASFWLRGRLRDLTEDLLRPGCRVEGLLEPAVVRGVKERVLAPQPEHNYRVRHQLWLLFMLEWWMRRYYSV